MDYKKFIDSVVGNIARKIEDEFNENDHPRDKGGKFTSKGGEGKGGAKKELLPETETEKAAKEELSSSSKTASKNVDKLIGAAMEGFIDNHELGMDFLKAMNVRTKDLYDEEGELDEEAYADRLEKAIRNNPEKAADNLEQLGDILYEEDAEEQGNKSGNKESTKRLKEIASDGFSEYPEMAQDFLKTMGVKLPKLSREEKEYYEEYPDEYQDLIMEKVHAAIERDPEAAKEALGEWADED